MIYLDHAAATPVDKRVLEAMQPYFADQFFNPSAAYLPAKKVAADYEAAKATIAHAIGAKSSDLVITAGATEANNLAFTAILREPVDDFLGTGSARPVDQRSPARRRFRTKDSSFVRPAPVAVVTGEPPLATSVVTSGASEKRVIFR